MADDQDLFAVQPDNTDQQDGNDTDADDPLLVAAHMLAVHFSEGKDIPVRFRKGSEQTVQQRQIKADSKLEKRFQEDVRCWERILTTMLAKLDSALAWRFINCSPHVGDAIGSVAHCKDFRDFLDYLILRRDKEVCDADELGGLVMLMGAFQRQIEKQMHQSQA